MPLHLFEKFLTSTTVPSGVHLRRTSPGMSENSKMVLGRVPDRPLREGEAGAELLDLDVRIDELGQLLGLDVYGHAGSFQR